MSDEVHVFGVRHLSPGAAWHLRRFLDEVKPKAVLVEGPADFTEVIPEITDKKVKPPIALLAYTKSLPVRTIVYPFATYSPEFQALQWARTNRAKARFIDLPSSSFVGIEARRAEQWDQEVAEAETAEPEEQDEAQIENKHQLRGRIYDSFAQSAGLADYETYWEQHFEQNLATDAYRQASFAFGDGLRQIEQEVPDLDFAENLVREAHMRREVQRCMDEEGLSADQIVVVVGAFHAPAVQTTDDAMSDEELAALPDLTTDLTLMPYSYFRLSRQSGYGAGNQAPAYFELFWECLQAQGSVDGLAAEFLSRVVRASRRMGNPRSTAEVIEGVRLARSLASLKDANAPTLRDLEDAAMTLIGHGELAPIAEALAEIEVGTRIGRLPEGARQTSIQLDFAKQLEDLKLEPYRKTVAEDIKLDLRENRRVKSEELAYIDLNRSFFLHRLSVLGIAFGKPPRFDNSSPWFETWVLQWEPEREIELVEAVLLGDTIELAAGFKFQQDLRETHTIGDAAAIVWRACLCGMPPVLEQARMRLQAITATSSDFAAIANACRDLGRTLKYGDIRNVDLTPLGPLLVELYNQAVIQLAGACIVDNSGAKPISQGMSEIHAVCDDFHEMVDESTWLDALQEVAFRDDLNAFLSGFASALLMERNSLEEDLLTDEVSRRLSPGMDADLGAAWFEGLASRNRYGLLSRLGVWECLATYIRDLSDEEFPRALVFLRRALGGFTPKEKRHIAENLGELWGKNQDQVSEAIETELNEDEKAAIDELGDMDFDDI